MINWRFSIGTCVHFNIRFNVLLLNTSWRSTNSHTIYFSYLTYLAYLFLGKILVNYYFVVCFSYLYNVSGEIYKHPLYPNESFGMKFPFGIYRWANIFFTNAYSTLKITYNIDNNYITLMSHKTIAFIIIFNFVYSKEFFTFVIELQ